VESGLFKSERLKVFPDALKSASRGAVGACMQVVFIVAGEVLGRVVPIIHLQGGLFNELAKTGF
jgi:hypothetical protein